MSFSLIFLQAFTSIAILILLSLFWGYATSPLSLIPGPFFAKLTNLWRFLDTYNGRTELTQQRLHEQYGAAVRIGPNVVSLDDPSLIRTIYSTKSEFLKSDFYTVNDTKVGSALIKTVFGIQSNDAHSKLLRPIAKFYKMSSLLAYEPLVNDTIKAFCQRLDSEFIDGTNAGKVCKIDEWLLFCAWDVIGQLTFSKPMGFLEKAGDDSGLLVTAEKALDYFATIGQMPFLDGWLAKNPVRPIGPPSFDSQAVFCAQQSIARQQSATGDRKEGQQQDMLDGFLEIKKTNPELIDDNGVVSALLVNILAGSDTTAILLRAIIYYVLKNPAVYRKLQKELDSAKLALPVSYEDSSKVQYLDAVIKEARRLHPGVGLLLERVVPATGLTLSDGTVIPPGTIVGMNPFVVHQNKTIYGQNSKSFNPGRWLRDIDNGETEEEYQDRLAAMKAADLTFGAGKRICLGKNIAILETYKIIATLFLTYDMTLVDPAKEWHVQNSWFVRQSGIDVTIRRRVFKAS
ncbi:hypothetical protein G7Y89_g6485 [Cudoniella acicularis]|uniref:Cytochrome P450 n=1 Tax=Cudoniella acicularis TaxID=354080 RepID=A0A8H4RMK9_9HELO|nr:hypothetical protein G7Y89_g6485 [Cudoniella acicularis]